MDYNRKIIDILFVTLFFSIVLSVVLIQQNIALFTLEIDRKYFDTIVLIMMLLFVWFFYRKTNKAVALLLQKQRIVFLRKENELVHMNQELEIQLYTDSLTQLKNRTAFVRDAAKMESPKLILLDIDAFKSINEYYSNASGDFLLCEIASMLEVFARDYHLEVYRVGGDEFALLEDNMLDLERYEEIADALVELFATKVFVLSGTHQEVEINVTLGICLEKEAIIEKASTALKEAKRKQINYLCYFKNIDNSKAYVNQVHWSNVIKDAIAEDRVIPYYQPIFDGNKKIIKYECLARIVSHDKESIAPINFLDISKKIKRYIDIEKIIIQKSFAAIEESDKIISVNLLARDMSDGDVSNFLIAMLNKYKVAKRVIFEILEEENIIHFDRVINFVSRLKKMGCKIAIDDFGSGYSNFGYLLLLKPDYLKIDGTLVRNVGRDKSSLAIMSAIAVFAKKSGIKTIAEYIHDEKVFQICKDLGIDEFQGFYLGKPSQNLT
ncbi:EAL domain-containing protein [Sulfurospirillum sp. 1612]|uniref:EAL domain-containing protein n=1 Tax=Sulfurospirillum sp. 1612 TaxID=3094835 RepID=UPI002F943B85